LADPLSGNGVEAHLIVSTMVLPLMAVLAGALCLLFFALFSSFYFRNRREALALRDRLAAAAPEGTGPASEGDPAATADTRERPGSV